MLEIQNISKYYKKQQVLNNISFVAEDGKVTGFVGPNGSGKSTALYCALGLIKANGGEALFDGVPYKKFNSPIETVGTVLDLKANYRNTSAIKKLTFVAKYCKIPKTRVSEIMDIAGISSIQNMKIKEMSTGMRNHNILSLLPSYHCLILHILGQSMLILNLLKRNKTIRILKKMHNELSARISAIYYCYGCSGRYAICSGRFTSSKKN